MSLLDKLVGKRTYVIGVVLAVLNLLVAVDVIPQSAADAMNPVFAALGLITLRAAVK